MTENEKPAAVLPEGVVEEDRRLRGAVERTCEELAELRWRHTLGATPRRTFADYAQQVGDSQSSIAEYAKGWQLRLDSRFTDHGKRRSQTDLNRLAHAEAETAAVRAAVADSEGVAVKTVDSDVVRRVRADEVKAVVRQRRDEAGNPDDFDFEAEAQKVARAKVAAHRVLNPEKGDALPQDGVLTIHEMAALERQAKRVTDLLAGQPDFGADGLQLLRRSWEKVQAQMAALEMAVSTAGVDLDAELADLKGAS